MSHRRVAVFWTALTLLAGGGVWAARSAVQQGFPHSKHQGLFPTCDGCHELRPEGVTYPAPALCGQCHDGQIVREVDWRAPSAPPPSNLKLNHQEVLEAKNEALGTDFPCTGCHTAQGAQRMEVRRAAIDNCLGCHAAGEGHYVGAPCAECHVPLAKAQAYGVAEIREFPVPPDHENEFLLNHGSAAESNIERCAVCHARELCSSCHVDAPSVSAIQTLPRDSRVAQIAAGREVSYPVPESHRRRNWWSGHAGIAEPDPSRCATCHTQTSCQSCHVEPVPEAVGALPRSGGAAGTNGEVQERGPGVQLERRPPRSHGPNFLEDHRALAASATAQCQACHTRNECTSCHTGSEALARPGRDVARYHPPNFLEQHSAPAFSREVECATCHNTEAFCRSCHVDQGLGATGRFDTGFHNDNSAWVFGHGVAARQGLESCASCHSQRDCLECHSALGGRRVSPHASDFDADRLRQKNPALCLRCHRRSILDR